MREDDLLHVVSHEEVVEASAVIPLHEGLLGPGRSMSRVRGGVLERTWWHRPSGRLWPLKSLHGEHSLPTAGRGLRWNSNHLQTNLWRHQSCAAEPEAPVTNLCRATGPIGDTPDTLLQHLGLLLVTEPASSKVGFSCHLNTFSIWLPILRACFSGLIMGVCKGRVGVERYSAGKNLKNFCCCWV